MNQNRKCLNCDTEILSVKHQVSGVKEAPNGILLRRHVDYILCTKCGYSEVLKEEWI